MEAHTLTNLRSERLRIKMVQDEKSREQLIDGNTVLRPRIHECKEKLPPDALSIEQAFNATEDKYRIILDSMQEAYFELDLGGNITFFNPATQEMLGYSSQELIHMNYREYVFPETARYLFKTFNRIYRTGKPAEIFDYQVIRKDGTKRFREISVSLIRDSMQNPTGFRCLARDVTKRKLAEESLRKKEKELENKSNSLAELNAALKSLLKQREKDRIELERNVLSNFREIISPYIARLRESQLDVVQVLSLDTIEGNLEHIVSPFMHNMSLKQFHFTPKEFHVASLVKEGRTTKEIATFLNISPGAVDFHRNNIRRKMGLLKKKVNLRSYLLSLL